MLTYGSRPSSPEPEGRTLQSWTDPRSSPTPPARTKYRSSLVIAAVVAALERSPAKQLTLRDLYAAVHEAHADEFPLGDRREVSRWQGLVRSNLGRIERVEKLRDCHWGLKGESYVA